MFVELWENVFDLFALLCSFGSVITSLFTSTLRSIATDLGLTGTVIDAILNFQILNSTIGSFSAMDLLFGAGIPIWFIASWIKFMKDVFT